MIVPTKVMPMVKSNLLGWGTKIRMGFELLRRPKRYPDRSVAEFVIDHFGQETLDYLAEPLLSGVYGGDPRELSVASVLPRFVEMETTNGSLGRAVMGAKRPPSAGSLFQDAGQRPGHADRDARDLRQRAPRRRSTRSRSAARRIPRARRRRVDRGEQRDRRHARACRVVAAEERRSGAREAARRRFPTAPPRSCR